jgi:hypothetical protein
MGKSDGNVTVVWNKDDLSCRPGDLVACSIYDASASTLYGRAVARSEGTKNEHSCTNIVQS